MDDKIKQIIEDIVRSFPMNDKIKQIIEDAIRIFFDNGTIEKESQILLNQEDPRFLILGATGVGKSSLLNAIFGEKLREVSTIPATTREFATHKYEIAGTTIGITDSPGYGEIGHDEEYSKSVVREAATHHAVTLVLKADEKGYERDRRIIGKAGRDPEFSLEKPLLIALNQIDKIKPLREWPLPYDVDWDSPLAADDTAKTRNIKEKVSLVKEQFKPVVDNRALDVIPVMVDEEEGAIFGVDRFTQCLFEILPEVAKYRFGRAAKFVDRLADTVIKTRAASAASVVFFNPVPVADFAVLSPLQIGMIIRLGAIYGKTIDRKSAIEVISVLGAGLILRTFFQTLISSIPVGKNVLGPPYAAAATYGMGKAAKAYFKGRGFSSEEFREDFGAMRKAAEAYFKGRGVPSSPEEFRKEFRVEVDRELRRQQKLLSDKRDG